MEEKEPGSSPCRQQEERPGEQGPGGFQAAGRGGVFQAGQYIRPIPQGQEQGDVPVAGGERLVAPRVPQGVDGLHHQGQGCEQEGQEQGTPLGRRREGVPQEGQTHRPGRAQEHGQGGEAGGEKSPGAQVVQEGLFHAGGAEALEQAGQPHRPGEEQGGDGAGPQLPSGGGALPFGKAEEQEQPAAEHQGQQEHIAEVVIHHQGGGQGQEEQAVPAPVHQLGEAAHHQGEQAEHVQPHQILVVEEPIPAQAVGEAEKQVLPPAQGGVLPLEKPGPAGRGQGELEQHQKVCQQVELGFLPKEGEKTEGAGQEKEEHPVEAHAAGVLQVEEKAAVPPEDVLELHEQGHHLLVHIPPGEGLFPKWVQAEAGVHQAQQPRRREKGQGCGDGRGPSPLCFPCAGAGHRTASFPADL